MPHDRFTIALTPRVAFASVVLCGVLLVGCHSQTTSNLVTTAPISVGVYTVVPERLSLTTELPGRIRSPLIAEIRPQVSGIVKERSFIEGATVNAGQVLYRIDPDSYRATYESARANTAKAQATVASAQLTAKRQAELAKLDAISQQDNEDAQASLQQAQATLAAARAAQETARIDLERTAIRAPIAGVVDISSVTPGALVTANQETPLTTIRQIDPIQVDITQSSGDLLRLEREFASGKLQRASADAATVRLVLEDGSTYEKSGELRFSGIAVNSSTGAITLRARFDNPDGLLLPGMYVRAVPETAVIEQALLIPQQAVTRDAVGATSALVVDAQNTVQQRALTVTQAIGNRWLVSAGLQPSERVIVEGSQKVRVGDVVQTHAADDLPKQALAAALQ